MRRTGVKSRPAGTEAGHEAAYRLFDAMPLGVGVIRDRTLVHANAALLHLLGRTRAEVVGRPALDLVAQRSVAEVRERQARRSQGEAVPHIYETWLRTATGEVRVELTVLAHGADWLVHVRDVTSRARRRMVLERLAALGAELPSLRTETEVLARMFQGLEELALGFTWLTPEGEGLRLGQTFVAPRLAPHAPEVAGRWERDVVGRWAPLLARAWREGSAYADDLALEASLFAEGAQAEGVRATLRRAGQQHVVAVRIDVEGTPRALLAVATDWLREEELAPVRLFGAQVSASLNAALTISRLSARNTALAALNRLASAAASAPHPGAFFGPGTEEIAGLLGCDAVALMLPEQEQVEGPEALVLEYTRGIPSDLRKHFARVPLAGTHNGEVFQTGEARVVELGSCPEGMREVLRQLGLQTMATVPLRVRSRVSGTLSVMFRERRRLTALELETLQAMGSHFAAALESHRLLNELRVRAEDLALLHEVGKAMAATLELDKLLATGVTSLARIVDTPDAYVMLPDASGERLAIRAAAGSHPELVGRYMPAAQPPRSLAAEAYRTRQIIRVEDARLDPNINQEMRRSSEGLAFLVLPMVVHEHRVGVVMAVETRRPRRFNASEVERASAIANQLSLALEGARLVEDLKKSYAELARAQEQLVHRERLAALGELSAVVAHEVRNPLGAIFNSVATIRRIIGPDSAAVPLVNIVGEEADRLNRIVADLLTFARPPSPHLYPVPVEQLLEEAVSGALVDKGAPPDPRVKVEWIVEENVPAVTVDERLMRQAFLNLALNALQAMPQGGTLRVVARRACGERPGVQVEFTDTGPGIPPELRTRIFEPFFTTKAQGTGLGLAVVKRIVESHLGQLALDTPETGGTTFRLFLPVEVPAPAPLAMSGI